MPRSSESASAAAARIGETLQRWLIEDAYPLWWTHGVDRVRGGFHEQLAFDGSPVEAPRRARLHPRQMYAFSLAADRGWSGPSDAAVRHGLEFFTAHYQRADRLCRTLVAPDGAALCEDAVLYDQAFALLGFAAAYGTLGEAWIHAAARKLHDAIRKHFAHPFGCFEEANPRKLPLLSNSHMHLLEAALAWMELDDDLRWRVLAAEIVKHALTTFIEPPEGFLLEYFDEAWNPASGIEGRIVEVGHQFEWAWLLLRWSAQVHDALAKAAALRLIDLGESRGIGEVRGVALSSLLTSGAVQDAQMLRAHGCAGAAVVHDSRARLWPQTERLKAACIAAETTREPRYWDMAARAAQGVLLYLQTPVRGLWYDTLHPDGSFKDSVAPASSFYHLVGAIAELEHTVKRVGRCRAEPQRERVNVNYR